MPYNLFQTSQTGGQRYSDTSPFNIPWTGICEIEILPLDVPLTNVSFSSGLIFFVPFMSCSIQFDFLHSSWQWVRLPQPNDLMKLNIFISLKYCLNQKISIDTKKYCLISFKLRHYYRKCLGKGTGEIEILPLDVPFTYHSVLVWFSSFHSCTVPFQFDFLNSSWQWVRLPEQNDFMKLNDFILYKLLFKPIISFKYCLNQKISINT